MQIITSAIISSIVCFNVSAQNTQVNNDKVDNFYFTESIEHYNYDNSQNNTIVLNQTLGFKIDATSSLELNIPYVSSNDDGFGMAEIYFNKDIILNPCKYVDSLSFNFGLELPTGQNTFSGDNLNVCFGFETNGKTHINNLNWAASSSWLVNNDYSYVPILGGKVSEDVFNAAASLEYVNDKFVFGGEYKYWNGGSDNYISTIGPTVGYILSDKFSAFGSIDFSIDQGSLNKTDTVFNFGLSIKF